MIGVLGGCAPFAHLSTDRRATTDLASPWYDYARVEVAAPVRQVWHVVRIDLTRARLAVSSGSPGPGFDYRAQTTSQAVTQAGATIAVNGGFYAIPTLDPAIVATTPRGSVLDVMGTSIADGIPFSGPQGGSRVITSTLCIGDTARIDDGQTCSAPVSNALSAGPLLLRDGQTVDFSVQAPDFAQNRHPRTAIGISQDGNTAWLVVVDGRQASSAGATLAELAAFVSGLGADDAMNFDGGGSSALVMRGATGDATVVSSPIDGGVVGRERAVANHLLVFGAPVRPR
jgi:Phosphodiester glycosidase